MQQKDWHSISVRKAIKELKVNPQKGLTMKEVRQKQKENGFNRISKEKKFSKFKIFLNQFRSPLVYILIIAVIITFLLGEYTDSFVIFLATFFNALFGFWEEVKVSKVLEKLQNVLKTKATVLRNGKKREIFDEDLVVGDVIFLSAGDKVPADAKIIEVQHLEISEAILTGESVPSAKINEKLPKKTALISRENMAYMGCLVEGGRGKAVVISIGNDTEAGKIATLLNKTKENKTVLQQKIARLGKFIGISISTICVFLFIGGIIRGDNLLETFEASVAIVVGGIPESLPIVLTVVLVIGMERLLRKRGLTRKLGSVETLGSTSVICFDKTKTLTKGEMEVSEIESFDIEKTLKIAALCNEAYVENPQDAIKKWKVKGSPTDKALLSSGISKGITKKNLSKKVIEHFKMPFEPTLRLQAVSLEWKAKSLSHRYFIYATGAPEELIKKSKQSRQWEDKVIEMTKQGLRVIAVAEKKVDGDVKKREDLIDNLSDLEIIGLIGLKDPIRKGIKKTIKIASQAGLKPIIITGDHPETARAIAKEAGLHVKRSEILEGDKLENINDGELKKLVKKIKIFARTEPKHKIRIVSAWQKNKKVVAMVGDGVNDAPALKKADIGIALGSGTDIAREVSDLVLLNDSFSIIIEAIAEGRTIIDNLRKSISYILADSFTSVVVVGVSKIVFGWPLPILPVQILWNNFIEDTLPNIAYAFEPREKGVMKRKPMPIEAPLLTKEMKILIFFTGLIDEFLTLLLFWILWRKLGMDLDYVRTLVFGAIAIDTAFVVYSYKNLRKNIWQINPFSNKWLNFGIVFVVIAFCVAVYVPFFQKILHTVSIGFTDWLILIAIGIISMTLIEVTKWFFISRHKTEE